MSASWVPFASAVLGALVGGLVSAATSVLLLRSSHAEERRRRKSQDLAAAVGEIAPALLSASQAMPVVVTARTPKADEAVRRLDLELTRYRNVLEGSAAWPHLLQARGLLSRSGGEGGLTGLEADQERLNTRLDADRHTYLPWVIDLLQDVGAGRSRSPSEVGPSGVDLPDAPPWTAPKEHTGTQDGDEHA